jgi:hypothetical protein
VQLVSAPHERRNLWREIKQSLRDGGILRYATRTFYGFAEIRYDTVAPTPDLVAKDAQARRPPATDGTLGDHAPLVAVSVRDRGLLDHIPTARRMDFKCGVVEVVPAATVDRRVTSLVDETVKPHEVAACAKPEPVEVHPSGHRKGGGVCG